VSTLEKPGDIGKEISKAYDSMAPSFNSGRNNPNHPFWLVQWPAVSELLGGYIEGAEILDIGGGGGQVAQRFLEAGAKNVYLIDASLMMVEETMRRRRIHGLTNLHPILMEASEMSLRPNSVDVAFAGYVVNHIDDLDVFIKRLSNVMKPGGVVCVLEPNEKRYIEYAYTYNVLIENNDFADGTIVNEKWLDSGGASVPVIYRHDEVINKAFLRAGFKSIDCNGFTEPVPSKDLLHTSPEVFQYYQAGPRTKIYMFKWPGE
jgi:ubiquinone/menaquinone biosynthesis C-methylase UbiE